VSAMFAQSFVEAMSFVKVLKLFPQVSRFCHSKQSSSEESIVMRMVKEVCLFAAQINASLSM
jgi:hypothetical protein